MIYAFQDREDLFLVCDLMTGGDLRFHIGKKKRFDEEQTSKLNSHLFLQEFSLIDSLVYRIHDGLHDSGFGIHA